MSSVIHRPLPEGFKSVSYWNELELRYLRWDYFVRSKNPDEKLLKSKEKVIRYAAARAMARYSYEFSFMKMDIDDISSIMRVYTVSYLSLYSAEADDLKKERIVKKLTKKLEREPTLEEIHQSDNNSLISFLEQRISDCASVFRKRTSGEPGFVQLKTYKRLKGNVIPTNEELIENPNFFGWEKVSIKHFEKIKSNFAKIADGETTTIDGFLYKIIAPVTSLTYGSPIEFEYLASKEPSPEEELIEMEESKTKKISINGVVFGVSLNDRISLLVDLYKERPPKIKLRILRSFVKWLRRRNGFQEEMKDEIAQVQKMILNLNRHISEN